MPMRFICCCVWLGVFCSDARAGQGESGQETKSKLLTEWELVGKSITTSRLEALVEVSRSRPPKKLSLYRKGNYCFVQSPNGRSFFTNEEIYNEKMSVQERYDSLNILNDSYQADLTKTRSGDGWLLSEFKMGVKRDPDRFNRGGLPWLSLFDGGTWVPDWIRDPNFVIMRSEHLHSGSTLRIHFRANIPGNAKVGYLDVDPRQSYRINGYDCHVTTNYSEQDRQGRLEYDNKPGIPILKVMVEESPLIKRKDGIRLSSKIITTYTIQYDCPFGLDFSSFQI